jgi:glycosyltransferase involved in cell wall biosynthesis
VLQSLRDVAIRLPVAIVTRNVDIVLAQNESALASLGRTTAASRVFPNVVLGEPFYGPQRLASVESTTKRMLAVGHHIPRKRFEIAVRCLADRSMTDWSLHIVGSPIHSRSASLRDYAERLGVADRITFETSASRERIADLMSSATVLVHPSAREGASGVVGEATACGLPVVCFEGTGAASVLKASGASGIAVHAKAYGRLGRFVAAVKAAESLPRRRSDIWTTLRIKRLLEEMLEQSRSGDGSDTTRDA